MACLQAGRFLMSLAGVIEDQEDLGLTGAPEFIVAVRTQLMLGESSYAIQLQPAYAHAFAKLDDDDGIVQVSDG